MHRQPGGPGCLIKGSATSELGTVVVGAFWDFAARSPAQWWLEYVRTRSNDADEPARRRIAQSGFVFPRRNGLIPEDFSQAFQSWGYIVCFYWAVTLLNQVKPVGFANIVLSRTCFLTSLTQLKPDGFARIY